MPKAKTYKCWYCDQRVDAEIAVCEEKEGTRTKKSKDGSTEKVPHITRYYFHKSCKEKQDNHKHYRKATETYLIKLHGGVKLPAGLVISHDNIAKLPNASYEIIYKAYQLAESATLYGLQNRRDIDNAEGKMFYGFKVMEGKLNEAYEQELQRKRSDNSLSVVSTETSETLEGDWEGKSNSSPSVDEMDISNFL